MSFVRWWPDPRRSAPRALGAVSVALAMVSADCSFPDFVVSPDDATVAPVDTRIQGDGNGNACGGTTPLPAGPDDPCGPCKTGKYSCKGLEALTCSVGDDRTQTADTAFVPAPGVTITWKNLTHTVQFAIGYPLHRQSTPVELHLIATRTAFACSNTTTLPHPDPACDTCSAVDGGTGYACKVSNPIAGSLTVKLFRGQPTDASPTKLAEATVAGDSVPESTGVVTSVPSQDAVFRFAADPASPPLNVSASIYFEISTNSTSYSFQLYGERPRTTAATPPPDADLWSRATNTAPPASWSFEVINGEGNRVFPFFVCQVTGCF